MSINTSLPAMFSSLALGTPNPVRTYTSSLEGKETKGAIKIVTSYDNPTKIIIEFEPKQLTKFPHTNAKRILKIDLKSGKGTLSRDAYTNVRGEFVPEATVEFRSDAEYNADNRKPPKGLIGSVLGQHHEVSVSSGQYHDIADLPVIKAYNNGDRRTMEIEIDKLIKKK